MRRLFSLILKKKDLLDRQICLPHPLQFGLWTDHGAVPSCYVIKEIIGYHDSRGSPVFCTFLDSKKVSDRI